MLKRTTKNLQVEFHIKKQGMLVESCIDSKADCPENYMKEREDFEKTFSTGQSNEENLAESQECYDTDSHIKSDENENNREKRIFKEGKESFEPKRGKPIGIGKILYEYMAV